MTPTEGTLLMMAAIALVSGIVLFLDWWGRRKDARQRR